MSATTVITLEPGPEVDKTGIRDPAIPLHRIPSHTQASQQTENNEISSSNTSTYGAGFPDKSYFRGVWHEIAFICVVIVAQLFTQMNLGDTVIQGREVAKALGVANNPAQEAWFVASFSTSVGAFVLVTGRLGDIYGVKTLYVTGWIWAGVFSLLCGLCGYIRNVIAFDIFRAMMGVGCAILMPNASALLGTAFKPGFKKNLSFALFGAVAPGGFVLGLAWGGIFTQLANDWRWTYWAMSCVCAALTVFSWWIIPSEVNVAHGGYFDWLGSIVGVSGLVLIFFSFTAAPMFGWDAAYVPTLLAVGVLLMVAFVFIEQRVETPVMPISMFTKPAFAAVSLSMAGGWMSFGMFQYYEPQFMMGLRGISLMETSLQFLPAAISGASGAVLSVYLLSRVPAWTILMGSMFAFLAAQVLLALTPIHQTYWAMTFPAVTIASLGPDLSFASASLIVSDQVDRKMQGAAGSFVNTVVNYSIGLGLGFAGNLEARTNNGGKDPVAGYRAAWWLGAGFAGLGIVATFLGRNKMARHKID